METPKPIAEAPKDKPLFVFVPPHWHNDVTWFEIAPLRGNQSGWYQDGWKLVQPTEFVERDLDYEALMKEASYGRSPR